MMGVTSLPLGSRTGHPWLPVPATELENVPDFDRLGHFKRTARHCRTLGHPSPSMTLRTSAIRVGISRAPGSHYANDIPPGWLRRPGAASFESTVQNNRDLPRLGLLAGFQDVQIDGSQVTRRRVKSILDLLGNHGPEFAGDGNSPVSLARLTVWSPRRKTTTGLTISAAPAFAAWLKAMKAMVLIW